MSFLTQHSTSADVIAITEIKLLVWNKNTLKKHKEIMDYYTMVLAIDLIDKVKSSENFKQILNTGV